MGAFGLGLSLGRAVHRSACTPSPFTAAGRRLAVEYVPDCTSSSESPAGLWEDPQKGTDSDTPKASLHNAVEPYSISDREDPLY